MPAPPCGNLGRGTWSATGGMTGRGAGTPIGGRAFELARFQSEDDDCDQIFNRMQPGNMSPGNQRTNSQCCNESEQTSSGGGFGRPLNVSELSSGRGSPNLFNMMRPGDMSSTMDRSGTQPYDNRNCCNESDQNSSSAGFGRTFNLADCTPPGRNMGSPMFHMMRPANMSSPSSPAGRSDFCNESEQNSSSAGFGRPFNLADCTPPGRNMGSPGQFHMMRPGNMSSPSSPAGRSDLCNESDQNSSSAGFGRPFNLADCTPPGRNMGSPGQFHMMRPGNMSSPASPPGRNDLCNESDQNSSSAGFGRSFNLADCTPPGRNMGSPGQFHMMQPGNMSSPMSPLGGRGNLCNESDPNSSSGGLGRPLNISELTPPGGRPGGFQQPRLRMPSEIKLSSAGRAFNTGECCDDTTGSDLTAPGGRALNPEDCIPGYVEPGSPQWISLYMDRSYALREGILFPEQSMQNRTPSNRYNSDPCAEQNRNANCDPNVNQQLYRNQAFQSPCPCPPRGGGANVNQGQQRQGTPWPDCGPAQPRMMPPNYGPSPQYNFRDNSPPQRAPPPRDPRSFSPPGGQPCPCPCPPGGAGGQSNVNTSRSQTNPCSTLPSIQGYNPAERSFNQNASALPCPPKPCPPTPQQQNCCPRPMPPPQQQQQQGRFNSPDCSPNRMGRNRSTMSFKPNDSGPKGASTPKKCASNLSMRELCNRKVRELQMENLVRDQYTPGVIQETLDGCENFNCISFDLTLGQDAPDTKPQVDPLTLIEAFAMRIDYERKQVNCARERNAKGKEKETDPDKVKKNEKKEIEKYFACQNDTELNQAIAGLLRAERIEELTNEEQPMFTTEMNRKEVTLPGSELNNFQDLTMITYTSTTKPV